MLHPCNFLPLRIRQFAGDETAVLHRAAAVGVENRAEPIEKLHGVAPKKMRYPSHARSTHAMLADLPSANDTRRPIQAKFNIQPGLLHPASVIVRRAQGRTKKSLAHILNLLTTINVPGV